eukprot:4504287-Pyramimonas_sp.AAC.1
MREFIPKTRIQVSSDDSWLDEGCLESTRAKAPAAGTSEHPRAVRDCSSQMLRAHTAHTARTRAKLKSLRPGTKGRWKLPRDLLHK